MIIHYLDPSAWIKRYCLEKGSEAIQDFFDQRPVVACSALGLIEVLSTLARKKKAGEMQEASFREKSREAEHDFALFYALYLTPQLLNLARKLPEQFALRGADTVHLASACFFRNQFVGTETEVRIITSDAELATAAEQSGFIVINPERDAIERIRRVEP